MANFRTNKKKAQKVFEEMGLLPKERGHYDYVLHHKDPNLKYTDYERYCEWRIEDLEVMTYSEHSKMHHIGFNQSEETKRKIGQKNSRPMSEETKQKISSKLKGKSKGPFSEEHREKLSLSKKGKPCGNPSNRKGTHWKLVDGKHIYY